MGLTVLGGNNSTPLPCARQGNRQLNSSCVIDNASIRYDRDCKAGTSCCSPVHSDLPAHRSNWVLVISSFAQFQKVPGAGSGGVPVCPASSPLFTPPVIVAPIVGGNRTGGVNTANWVICLRFRSTSASTTRLPDAERAEPDQQQRLAGAVQQPVGEFHAVGTPNVITTGGTPRPHSPTKRFPFCNGGRTRSRLDQLTTIVARPVVTKISSRFPISRPPWARARPGRTCTNYYPTEEPASRSRQRQHHSDGARTGHGVREK